MSEEIQLTVEFSGVGKKIAETDLLQLNFPAGITYHDVVERLADDYPEMVGILIDESKRSFLSSTMFVINNEMMDAVMIMDKHPKDGEHLALLSIMTGG